MKTLPTLKWGPPCWVRNRAGPPHHGHWAPLFATVAEVQQPSWIRTSGVIRLLFPDWTPVGMWLVPALARLKNKQRMDYVFYFYFCGWEWISMGHTNYFPVEFQWVQDPGSSPLGPTSHLWPGRTGWVWELTGWSSRLSFYQSYYRKLPIILEESIEYIPI